MKRLHLIIDSLKLGSNDPHDVTLYLEGKLPSDLQRVTLKGVTLYYNKGEKTRTVYIHCNILNKDENLFNGKKSDIIGFIAGIKAIEHSSHTFGNISKSIKSNDFTSIRFTLSERIENLSRIIYELEFSS